MGLDLRIPLGLMFLTLGLLLLGYGALTWNDPMYLRSIGQNVNVVWGGIMSLFGLLMLFMAYRGRQRQQAPTAHATDGTIPRRAH